MSNKAVIQFAVLFAKLAKEYNDCSVTNNYSKQSKIKKKLLGMLAFIDAANNAEEILCAIFETGNKYAIMWISNFKFKNKLCIEIVKAELRKIKTKKQRINLTTVWERLLRKK